MVRPVRGSRTRALESMKDMTMAIKSKDPNDFSFFEKKAEEERKRHEAEVRELNESAEESDEQPEGLKGCLKGLTIVVSGVFIGITREEMENTIKRFGGK
jgi:NAD-dependent DNA ligase